MGKDLGEKIETLNQKIEQGKRLRDELFEVDTDIAPKSFPDSAFTGFSTFSLLVNGKTKNLV